ncbi:MAG TPA: POTRA domain-containing protein [Steroidobacter sp.]|nr:POTRA domain-containing protein [Steroidobacter sp.]
MQLHRATARRAGVRDRKLCTLASAWLALSSAATATAQEIPNRLPPSAQPGRELQQPEALRPIPDSASIDVPEAPAAQPPAGSERVAFKLTAVNVAGATLLTQEELQRHYADKIGRTVSVAEMFQVAAAIENEYRSRGYVISRALLPEQQIERGVVRIVVVEGFISDIQFSNDVGAARAQIEALLSPLREQKPVSIAAIERRLLLANDLAGVQVRGTLQPSNAQQGAATLVIASDREPVYASALLDNRNSPYTGSNQAIVRASWNSFTPQAGTLTLVGKSAFPYRREHMFQAAYDQSIGGNGMTAGVAAFAAKSHPGKNLTPLDVHSEVESASATVAYPILRSRVMNLRVDGTFDYTNLDTDVLGQAYTEDRLRVLRVGLTFDRSDSWQGVNAARVSLSKGLDIFGASPRRSELLSRYDGRSDFTKISAQFVRLQTLTDNFSLLASAVGQITWDSLLSSEQIGLGGPEFGRAYDTSEVSGDKGIDGVLELRYRPSSDHEFWGGTQFFVYYDIGKVWNVALEYPQEQSLASAGAGVRLNLPGNLYASLEVAKALTHIVASEGDKPTRAFFSISAQL